MHRVQQLTADHLQVIYDIDRSEEIDLAYTVVDGTLASRRVEWRSPPWQSEGTGEHSVAAHIASLSPILTRGAALLAVMNEEKAAGVAVVEPRFEPRLAWLAFLHVSRPHRRRGIASSLWEASCEIAREEGATSMYVSATPTGSAVGFYLSRGAELARPPHPELHADEPDDIHLVCTIG